MARPAGGRGRLAWRGALRWHARLRFRGGLRRRRTLPWRWTLRWRRGLRRRPTLRWRRGLRQRRVRLLPGAPGTFALDLPALPLALPLLALGFGRRLAPLVLELPGPFGLVDPALELVDDGRAAGGLLDAGRAVDGRAHLVLGELDVGLVDGRQQTVEAARLVRALDGLVGDDVAEVEDHVVLAIEDDLGHGPAERVFDVGESPLRLPLVDPGARRVGHLGEPPRELVPQAAGPVPSRSQRVLRVRAGRLAVAERDRGHEIPELALALGGRDVLRPKAATGRDQDRPVGTLDIGARPLADQACLESGVGSARSCALGNRRADRAEPLAGGLAGLANPVTRPLDGSAQAADLLLERLRRLRLDIDDVRADVRDLLGRQVRRPLRGVTERAARHLVARDRTGRLVEIDVRDRPELAALDGEDLFAKEAIVPLDERLELRVIADRDDRLTAADHDRVGTIALDLVRRDDSGAAQEASLVHDQCDDPEAVRRDDDVADGFETHAVGKAEDVLADDRLSLAHDCLLPP